MPCIKSQKSLKDKEEKVKNNTKDFARNLYSMIQKPQIKMVNGLLQIIKILLLLLSQLLLLSS